METSQTTPLEIEISYVQYVNLAMQQNALRVVYELKLTNRTEGDFQNLECVISSSPEILRRKIIPIAELKSGETLALRDLDIELDYAFLLPLSEAVKGKLSLQIVDKEIPLCERDYPLTAFAADQWLGSSIMPELLASFVTPNLEIIAQLQAIIADELAKATGSSSIEGYQNGKTRAYEICSAIYRAIHSWGIHYSNPPASFGTPGQRIRFADAIFQYHVGTCLDTTLLFASVMENCGLHPVILLQSGHAYIGCHLCERYFPDIPMDDLQAIRKLVDLDEFVVIETTCVTRQMTFSEAEAIAKKEHLNLDGDFECAIDIVRARYSGIRSLPLKRSTNGMELLPPKCDVEELEQENRRNLQENIDLSQLKSAPVQSGRIAQWSQKLLDLSLHNRLLNVRDNRYSIPLACPNIALLEDKIAANEMFLLNPLSNLLNEKDIHDLSMLRNSDVKPESLAILEKELSQKRLWALLGPADLKNRLQTLFRQSHTDLEEGGVNTLFLAIGFLEWKTSPRESRSYLAPILLIPERMVRKSIVEGIRISRLDEETIINETLLELLRSQFQMTIPGISPLPTDDSGVDVPLIMQIFRQSIRNMPGWEVREEARLGHFSFGKYVMWNDLTARMDKLKENPLVNHLISGGGIFHDGIEVFPPEELEKHLKLDSLFCPLSADSSQLTAVLYSALGKTFVLHGPPGTGKSQTITNIIAHNLALGRRVLFVSEKKAALDVVHNRLTSIGLKPFCLELHSNKSGKTEVLQQFSEALQVPESASPADWLSTIHSLEQLRSELNSYVSELHHQYPNGISAYDCFALLANKETRRLPELHFSIDYLRQTKEDYTNVRRLVGELASAWETTSPDAIATFKIIDSFAWSPVQEQRLLQAARALRESLERLRKKNSEIAVFLALPESGRADLTYQTALLLKVLRKCGDIPSALLSSDFPEHTRFLNAYSDNALHFLKLQSKLKSYHLEQFEEIDFSGLSNRIKIIQDSSFLARFFKERSLLKEFASIKKMGGSKLTLEELKALIPDAEAFLEAKKSYTQGQSKAAELLGKKWNGEQTDWNAFASLFTQCQAVLDAIQGFAQVAPAVVPALKNRLLDLLPDASNHFKPGSPKEVECTEFFLAWNDFQEKLESLSHFASRVVEEQSFEILDKTIASIIANAKELRGVLRYRSIAQKLEEYGLDELVAAVNEKKLSTDGLLVTYETYYHKLMLDQILADSTVLCQFNGLAQNQRIQEFCELDSRYARLSQKIVFAKLAANLPRRRLGPCPEGTELGLLKRECEKRARQKAVRQLLEQIPTLAPVLKPCFLMSPLSVAQYLPPDTTPFDLIIFDEASQIPVWDAIGVIARGRQLIVVGDPKQMPPTNFFQKGDGDDADAAPDGMEDMESILDESLAAGLPSTYLSWHYRSRHEDLISFSNHYYYGDRLCTFPAARHTERLGIRFQFVPGGIYERRGSRTNRKEANALVNYIFQHLEADSAHRRSFGVVTFSQAQRELIEDLMEAQRAKHPELEKYFNSDNLEAPFVKNLENVQGDERDVILFSIGYAPDMDGKFSMNFGPLNRQGGERRLNVAITRAKEQVVVFSSIHATQIDLARTNAVGAAHLRYFLEYAERGIHDFGSTNESHASESISRIIADFLKAHGYVTETNVGSSGCQIDVGVRNPERPDEYLLGIECDGESYARQRTTRDRDGLRTSVLQNLGWQIYHAWSVDWMFDRARCEQELLSLLDQLKSNTTSEEPTTSNIIEPAYESCETVEEPSPAPPPESKHSSYSIWRPLQSMDSESFFLPESRALIQQQLQQVIQIEGPIYDKLLKRRILRAWGFARIGEAIKRVLDECLPPSPVTTQLGEDRVFWPDGISPAEYRDFRVGNDEESRRSIDEIPPEEIANAMQEILIDFSSCEMDTLFRETVKLFGMSMVTAKVRKYLEFGVRALKESGRL